MINLRPLFFLACFFVTEIFLHPSHAQVRIIDADTIELDGKKIRLHGVDAPEASQKCLNSKGKVWFCGQHATQALEVLISSHPNKRLSCVESSKDRYQRVIAECFFDEQVFLKTYHLHRQQEYQRNCDPALHQRS